MGKGTLRGFVAFLLLMVVGGLQADSLNEEQARAAAVSFFSPSASGNRLRAKSRQLILRSAGHQAGYYVFERPEGGVVFVADDDGIGRTVLGYTEEGGFDADNLPVGLQDWLGQVSVLMQAVHEGKIAQKEVVRKAGGVQVAALIKTRWNQTAPYNNLCPIKNGKRCITGCVATAMAQVMKYWEWPVHGYGSVEYYDKDGCGQTLMQDLSLNEYDWSNMLNSYTTGYNTGTQATAVATLMRDCGYAVHMQYTPDWSAASVSASTMRTYFHYSPAAKDRYVKNFSTEMWHEFIRKDLDEGRPVLYSGQSSSGGHQFILDGYDSEDYYHVNWGWGGYQDGWFMLTDLNGYNDDQEMINHLEPDYAEGTSFSYTYKNGILTINGNGYMPDAYSLETAPWSGVCESVKKIVIGSGVKSIVDNFGYSETGNKNFTNLEEVVLPEGLQVIGRYAFDSSALTSVSIPSTVTKMDWAFYWCKQLTALHLPKALEDYRDYTQSLVQLTVDEENPWLSAEDNLLYSKDGKSLLYVPRGLSRIVVSEACEKIAEYDRYIFRGDPVFFRGKKAPVITTGITSSNVSKNGNVYIPYESTGYTSWKANLPAGWNFTTYNNLDYFLQAKVDWSLTDGVLNLYGVGVQQYADYGYDRAPYYSKEEEVKKLVVSEGVQEICWGAFWNYSNMTAVELPSTLNKIDSYGFAYGALKTITCHAQTAPNLSNLAFLNVPSGGTLRVPNGSDYSTWQAQLPSDWKIVYITRTPICTATCYDKKQSIYQLNEWETLLNTYPNTVGVVKPGNEVYAMMTRNLLIADAASANGYSCPYFSLTDLTNGYSTATKAPQTGFRTPVPFTVTSGSYARKLKKGYNTACLPFTFSEELLPENAKMYAYSHFDSENSDAVFVAQTTTDAGRACFLALEADADWKADLSGMTISKQPASTADANMRGTFVTTDDYALTGYNPRSSDGVFAPLEKNLHPFRACFLMSDPAAAAKMHIRLVDNADADAVKDVLSRPVMESTTGFFTLDGKHLAAPRKGQPFIHNGKIVVR